MVGCPACQFPFRTVTSHMMRVLHVQAQARGAPAHASHQASRQRPSLAPSRRQLLSAVPAAGLLALVAGRSQAVGLESIDLPSVGLPGPAAQALEELRSSNQVCRGLGLSVPSALPSYLVAQVKQQPHPLQLLARCSAALPTPRFTCFTCCRPRWTQRRRHSRTASCCAPSRSGRRPTRTSAPGLGAAVMHVSGTGRMHARFHGGRQGSASAKADLLAEPPSIPTGFCRRKQELADLYCRRQAELGVGDCGGLRVRWPGARWLRGLGEPLECTSSD